LCPVFTSSRCVLRGLRLQFLADLGLAEENPGVYNGSWGGSGALLTSVNPSTGRPIARIRQATVEEYESCVSAMVAAQETWQLVRDWVLFIGWPKLAVSHSLLVLGPL
jgi:aldehyde dehydrogenase family 7 member A1